MGGICFSLDDLSGGGAQQIRAKVFLRHCASRISLLDFRPQMEHIVAPSKRKQILEYRHVVSLMVMYASAPHPFICRQIIWVPS